MQFSIIASIHADGGMTHTQVALNRKYTVMLTRRSTHFECTRFFVGKIVSETV